MLRNNQKPLNIAEDIRRKFTVSVPLFLSNDTETMKLEMKPYLQPFEQELAIRELLALVNPGEEVTQVGDLYVVSTACNEEYLREHLTYWQRVGRLYLEPTVQTSLEFTQNGILQATERKGLHNARRLRYGPHDLHEYRGKFFPQLVRSLINISGIPENAIVLDPMCGSGTTSCEALAAGCSAIGADLNPLSVLIAQVKSSLTLEYPTKFSETTKYYLEKFVFELTSPEKIWQEDDLRYLSLWFDSVAIANIASIIAEIHAIRKPLYRDFFRVCLSNIIRSVSWQKSTDLRVRKEVLPYEPGNAISRFKEEVNSQIDRIYPYLCVLPKWKHQAFLDIRHGNAKNIASLFPDFSGKVDLLITSPPYATALPYLDTDRLSLIVLGLLPRKQHKYAEAEMVGTREISERGRREAWEGYLSRKRELPITVASLIDSIAEHNHSDGIGFRRRNLPALLGKYFLNMLDAMQSAHTLMKPGAHGYYIVGNNSTVVANEKIEIPTNTFLFEIAAVAGWTCRESISMELLVSRDIFRENRGSEENILCLDA
jgi:site-specific DNA-methyltransferase (cytosine-N4-specific)